MRRLLVVPLLAGLLAIASTVAFAAGPAPYNFGTQASGGLNQPGVVSTGANGQSRTNNQGTSSASSASALSVAGNEIAPGSHCSASRTASQNSEASVTDSQSGQTIGGAPGDPAGATLFASSCYAQANSANNAHSTADASLARVDVPGSASVAIGSSHEDTTTTSGESDSNASFTGAQATTSDGTSATVVQCSASSSAAKDGTTTSQSSGTLVSSGDQTVAMPTTCPFASSSSTK